MSFALLSAISLMCVDAASAARPLAEAPPVDVLEIAMATTVQDEPAQTDGAPVATVSDVAEDDVFADPLVFEGEDDEAVAEKLINYIESIDTLAGDFTQVAPSGAISDGRFYLRRPGFLRFEYEPPTPLLIIANGGMVYVQDKDLETTDSYPAGKTPLKFLLRKTIDRDDAQIVNVDRGVDNVAVTFASSDAETEGELTLIASAPDFALRRWIIRDLQGGITVVSLDNVVAGERVANRLFAVPEAGGIFRNR